MAKGTAGFDVYDYFFEIRRHFATQGMWCICARFAKAAPSIEVGVIVDIGCG
jgi:hypothetical protein